MRAAAMLRACTSVGTFDGPRSLTTASGFFFERGQRLFVVTAAHVVADAASGHHPDALTVQLHLDAHDLTQVQFLSLPLYANGRSLWREGRDGGGAVDVAVLEIDRSRLGAVHALAAFAEDDVARTAEPWDVGDALAIPGFPLGFHDAVYHLPVVRQAAIASAWGVRFQGKGFFLTDGRTHRGISGAPVLRRAPDAAGGAAWRLLGVHSSRMDMAGRDVVQDESLGLNCAWYADILLALTGAEGPPPPR